MEEKVETRESLMERLGHAGKQESPVLNGARECAAFIGRTPGAIYQLVHERKIPFHKPDGNLTFFKAEVIEWLKKPRAKDREPSISKFQEVRKRLRSLKTETVPSLSGSRKDAG